jgi:putative DNA primase/helicase
MTTSTTPIAGTTVAWTEAKKYASLGFPIVPLHHRNPDGSCSCGDPDCPPRSRAKHPRIKNWQNEATTDPAKIDRWRHKWPQANIGVRLGKDIIDVEYDTDEGRATAERLLNGIQTPTYTSGSRSVHRLLRWREGLPGKAVFHVAGLEIRTGNDGKGAQSVLPPSIHPTGAQYKWIIRPDQAKPAEIPPALLALIVSAAGEEEMKTRPTASPQIEDRALALDALAGLSKDRANNYTDWLAVGMALHSVDSLASMLTEWDTWSQCSDKYGSGVCAKHWQSFTAGAGVSIGSLIYWAKQNGWQPPWQRKGRANVRASNGRATQPGKVDDEPGIIKMLADEIESTNRFARDAGGKIYHFAAGVFKPRAEKFISAQVKRLCVEWGQTKKWSTHLAAEVAEFIRVDSPELPDRPRADLLNTENGMVRVEDGILLPHDPKYLSNVQLPVKYDPAATCPNIERFVAETFPADAYDLAWQIPGVLMVPIVWLQKAILLTGEGCNGKSVWLSMIVRFIGKQNVATMPLHKLEADKFAVSRLVGKLANICADLPSEHLAGTSIFKAIVGGDSLTGEYKFKDSFDLEPFVRLVFSANHPPRSADSSPAFFRRWLVIPFDRVFAPEDQIPRDVLDARLQAPEELSGLLNKALVGLRQVKEQRGFTEPESVQAAWRDFHATTDPLAVWLSRFTIDEPETFCPGAMLRTAYNAAAEREGRPMLTETAFGRAFRKQRPSLDYKQRMFGGRLQWCFIGIGLTGNDSQTSQGSQENLLLVSIARARES